MTVMDLDKLNVWVRACEFAVAVYKDVISVLPPEEKWNLGQQLRRSAQSIPANIAEGHGRFHYLDNMRFCYMARGSLTEVESHIALAHKLGFVTDSLYQQMNAQAESIGKQLNSYIAILKRTKQGEKTVPAGYSFQEESSRFLNDRAFQNEDPS